MTDRIGIIGDPDSILAFKAVGVETFGVSAGSEAKEYIKEMARKNFKVIFITEKLAIELKEFLQKYREMTYPAIVPIPTSKDSLGIGMEGIKSDMERAIGADILFRNE